MEVPRLPSTDIQALVREVSQTTPNMNRVEAALSRIEGVAYPLLGALTQTKVWQLQPQNHEVEAAGRWVGPNLAAGYARVERLLQQLAAMPRRKPGAAREGVRLLTGLRWQAYVQAGSRLVQTEYAGRFGHLETIGELIAFFGQTKSRPAAQFLKHFLQGSGSPLKVDPREMLRDLPGWRGKVEAMRRELQEMAHAVATEQIRAGRLGSKNRFPLQSPRSAYTANSDKWGYALHQFEYWITAQVSALRTGGPDLSLDMIWTVHVFDHYDWDPAEWGQGVFESVPNALWFHLEEHGRGKRFQVTGAHTDRVRWTVPAFPQTPHLTR